MCMNTAGDIYDSYQRNAQLVADILLRNNLDPTRVKQHNTFDGKNCPQVILAGNYWEEFMKMVEINYILQKDYSDVEITLQSDNPNIVDKTNEENPWQGKLRFGYLNTDSLYDRVKRDLSQYGSKVEANMVFTQLNYTNNKLCVGNNQFIEIAKPDFIHSVLGSDREDSMFKVM